MTAPVEDSELMRLYDGELPPDEAARLEERLRGDLGVEQDLAQLERLGDLVRAIADERGAGGDSIADSVMARIDQDRTPRAVPGWRRVAPLGAAVLAMAAAAVLVVQAGAPRQPVARTLPAVAAPAQEPAPVVEGSAVAIQPQVGAAVDDDGTPSVAIESVDFGARDGTIFMVQSGESETPVVWLVDDPALPGGRIEPL